MKNALIVFVRTPESGRVKTRLQRDLGKAETFKTYKSFITETLNICDRIRGADKFLGCFPTTKDLFLKGLSKKHKLRLFDQTGRDLGEKFINAFNDRFKEGYKKVVIIGSDSPTIPVDYIKQAFKHLDKNDFILGPCTDGGYYLVGAKKISKGIFKGIPWDSSEVLNRTLDKLYSNKGRFYLLPFWYDIDDISDLEFYKRHLRYLKKVKK
jgi:rSAM/selenodomain-associated transferase 1